MIAFTGIAPLTPAFLPEGLGDDRGSAGETPPFEHSSHGLPGLRGSAGAPHSLREPLGKPLTLTLSPEGRGDDGAGAAAQRAKGVKVNPGQVERARKLRTGMSDAERRLWYFLRDRRLAGFKFVRQFPIGRYYADFACREAMLVIEADGGQHGGLRDDVRDLAITSAGYKVLHFWNDDILHRTETVLDLITQTLGSCVPSPLRGEGQGEGPSSSLNNE